MAASHRGVVAVEGRRQRVDELFSGKSLLITGASGFLGKVLVEKLLFSVPGVKKIYLLIRPQKNDSNPKDRLAKILKTPIFNRTRHANEDLLRKLIPIKGDMLLENLGLSDGDARILCEEVSIVFHCAASVKFDEPLKPSIQMNVIGTQRLVSLCKKMPHLVSFVHASTAYSNCNLTRVEERVYEISPENPEQLIDAVGWMSEEMLKVVTPILLRSRPNTYTFAKAVAENVLVKEASNLPLIIVRPSIIGSTWREPLPGWTDNMNGPTGIFVGVGKGLITNMCGCPKSKADIVPVDIVANALIVAAAHVMAKLPRAADTNGESTRPPPMVVHCSSGALNPLKWSTIANYVEQFYHEYPLDSCYRVPSTQFHSSHKFFLLNFYLKHYYPAYFLDTMSRLVRRKSSFVRIYGRVWKVIDTLHYFTTRGWHFESHNVIKLWDELCDQDKKVDWNAYLFDYLMGVKLYLLHENLDSPKARTNLIWLKQLSLYANIALWAAIVRLVAWRRTVKERWTWGTLGVLVTYALQNIGKLSRARVHLKSLEEFKRTSLPAYAQDKGLSFKDNMDTINLT